MDWTQTLTFIATTIASVFGFFLIIRDDIKKMDEKLERLFEKLLLKEQGKGG